MTAMQPFDFRGFLDHLKQTGDLVEIPDPIGLQYEVGALCRTLADRAGPGAMLTTIDGFSGRSTRMAVNIYGERRRLAAAFRVTDSELLGYVSERMKATYRAGTVE